MEWFDRFIEEFLDSKKEAASQNSSNPLIAAIRQTRRAINSEEAPIKQLLTLWSAAQKSL